MEDLCKLATQMESCSVKNSSYQEMKNVQTVGLSTAENKSLESTDSYKWTCSIAETVIC